MSEENTQETRYTCDNPSCPCMDYAMGMGKARMMKAKNASTGDKLGLICYFTDEDAKEAHWKPAHHTNCNHIEVCEVKGPDLKPILAAVAALGVLGGGGYGLSQLFGGGGGPDPEGEPLQQATYLIESVLNEAFPASEAK